MTDQNHLSGREIEILQLVAKGLTNREIAQKLTISPNTVKVHLSNIFEKISVASRTEATLYGIEHGLVDVPGGRDALPGALQPGIVQEMRTYAWLGLPLIVLLTIFLVTLTFNVWMPPPNPDDLTLSEIAERWRELAPMPAGRAGMAAAAYDGQIFAIAGEGPQGVSGSVFRYSTETDSWAQLSNKPTPVADVHAVLIGEKIYVPGGRGVDGRPTNVLEIYDPRRDAWLAGAPLPEAISAYGLADFEGQMYLFGGWDGTRAIDAVYVYDPTADTWRAGTKMPTARSHAGVAVTGGKIFIIGGWDGNQPLNVNQSYNPQRDLQNDMPWQEEISLPENIIVTGMQEIAGIVFVLGIDETEGEVLIHLNAQARSWNYSEENFPVTALDAPGVTASGQDLVILGGKQSNGTYLDHLLMYQAIYIISIPIITR